MLNTGPAKKVTIHLNEDTSARKDFLYNEIFAFLVDRGVAGASLIRPEFGFGSHHRIHRNHAPGTTGEHLPVRIEFIDSAEKVASLMPELCEILSDGLIEAHDTVVYRAVAQEEKSA